MVAPRSNPAAPLSQPPYPSLSRRLGEQGTVVMQLYVLSDGSVANADLVKSSGYLDLDNAALSNAYNWLLEPGTINGKATAMWGRFAVTFKLSD
jgi:periplasmic protein TonB